MAGNIGDDDVNNIRAAPEKVVVIATHMGCRYTTAGKERSSQIRRRRGKEGKLDLLCYFHLPCNPDVFHQGFFFLPALLIFCRHFRIYFYGLCKLPGKTREQSDERLGEKPDDRP